MSSEPASPPGAPTESRDVGPATESPPPPRDVDFLNWNFWVSNSSKAENRPIVANHIALNQPQTMWFRISSIDHSAANKGVGKVGLSNTLGTYIAQQKKADNRGMLAFVALVIAADPSAIRIPNGDRSRPFSIDMDKLAAGPPTALGTTVVEESLRASNIGEFSFKFTALKPGRHRLGIVLVEKSSGIPMQTLSIDISPDAAHDQQLTSLGRNVGVAIGGTSASDFSLVLQDLSSDNGPSLISVLIAHDRANGANRFFTWNTGRSLEEVQNGIGAFRSSLDTPLSPDEQKELSWQFGRVLFEPQIDASIAALSPANRQSASEARAALWKAATDAALEAQPATLLVRMVPRDPGEQVAFSSPTLPVGSIALGVDAHSAVYLGERMIVALLLPGQSIDDTAACPDQWYVTKPPKEVDAGDAVSIASGNSGKFWDTMKAGVKPQSMSLAELKAFLVPAGATAAQSVVISYLGHNRGNGELYFKRDEGSVVSTTFRQQFAASSVAIINACEVATDKIEAGSVIAALSQLHVGTTIATISPVNGALAGAYMRCLSSVLAMKPELTVGELQLRATQCLFSKASGEKWGGEKAYFGGNALKYFLVGNPYQKICLPKERP